MSRLAFPLLLLLAPLSCVETSARPTRVAVPIKSACTATSRPASSVGLDVRPGRRHSEAGTIFVTNLGDKPRSVLVSQVSRAEGACDGEWTRTTALDFDDAETQARPEARELAPQGQIQIRIGPQRAVGSWDCVKLGLALWMKVDDATVCADAGTSIAERDE